MEIVEDLEYCQNEHLGAGPEDRYVIFDVLCDEHWRAYHCRDAERASKRVSGSNVILCGGADSEAGVKGGVEF